MTTRNRNSPATVSNSGKKVTNRNANSLQRTPKPKPKCQNSNRNETSLSCPKPITKKFTSLNSLATVNVFTIWYSLVQFEFERITNLQKVPQTMADIIVTKQIFNDAYFRRGWDFAFGYSILQAYTKPIPYNHLPLTYWEKMQKNSKTSSTHRCLRKSRHFFVTWKAIALSPTASRRQFQRMFWDIYWRRIHCITCPTLWYHCAVRTCYRTVWLRTTEILFWSRMGIGATDYNVSITTKPL